MVDMLEGVEGHHEVEVIGGIVGGFDHAFLDALPKFFAGYFDDVLGWVEAEGVVAFGLRGFEEEAGAATDVEDTTG